MPVSEDFVRSETIPESRFNEKGNDAVHVRYVDDRLIISKRRKAIQKLELVTFLKMFGMNPTRTRMMKELVLERQFTEDSMKPYRDRLESLMYVMMSTWLGRFQFHVESSRRTHNANCLIGFADTDRAMETDDQKSVGDWNIAASKATWLAGLLGNQGEVITGSVTIFQDNHGCIRMAKNPGRFRDLLGQPGLIDRAGV